jgi:transposase-like protein
MNDVDNNVINHKQKGETAMERIERVRGPYKKKIKVIGESEYRGLEVDVRMSLIEALIPIGLMKVEEELQAEVRQLCGARYERGSSCDRYGYNPGFVVLGGQRVGMRKPRVRDQQNGKEVELSAYVRLQTSKAADDLIMRRLLAGISCGRYESAAGAIPEAFGLSGSNISRKFIRISAKRLKELQERDLSGYDFTAMWLDGKRFSEDGLIVALGLTMGGGKVVLGLVESATENSSVVGAFLHRLLERGLRIDQGLLVIADGSKGLIKAAKGVFEGFALFHRCQWHKRENVVSYVSKTDQPWLRKRLQHAYERPTYDEAKRELKKIHSELLNSNQSAAASLEEGLEETLTLHRLGVFGILGKSLKTTNCIESILSQVDYRCRRVGRWHNSSQRQRWMASALLDIELKLNRIQGYRHLPKLREAIQEELGIKKQLLPLAA